MKKSGDMPRYFRPDFIRVLYIFVLTILFGVFGWNGYAYAEGSRTLYPASYPAGGARADLDLEPSTGAVPNRYVGQVRRSTFLYVYAQAGEYIVLGSRNRSSSGDINVYNPQDFGVPGDENYNASTPGTPDFTCSAGSSQPGPHFFGGTTGTIVSRVQELAGPNSADNTVLVTNGFQPCAYRAPVTGTYGVLFNAAPAGAANPDGNIATPIIEALGVSAWDVTVRANRTSTTDINGRLFTYAFIGYTGNNQLPVYSSLYYVTQDGYRYEQDLNGLDGNGYALYANSMGFLDSGQPLYKDLRGNEALVTTLPLGVTTQRAQYPTFFSDVSPSGANATEVNRVLTALNIPLVPPSPTVTNVQFTGNVYGSTSYLGAGGTFSFDTSDTMTFQIVISLDGVSFDPANVNNRTLTGLAASGSHIVVWDGTNNSAANFPAGGPYPFKVSGRNGEVHFPIIDAENNYFGGPQITRLNGIGAPDTTVFYDDRGYVLSTGVAVGTLNGLICPTATPAQPVPAYSLAGVDSSTAYRTWGVNAGTSNTNFDCTSTNAWGDAKGVNLWTYYSVTPPLNNLSIISVNVDAATTVTGAATATAGSTVQGTFTFANYGTGTAHGITYTMSLTPGLTSAGPVTFGNLPAGTTAAYNNATGAVTFAGTPLPTTLTAGQAVLGAIPANPMTYSYTVPASVSVTVSTAIATTDADGVPANNNDSVTTYIGAIDVMTTINVLSIAAPYSTVTGNIMFTNNGANAATGVTYTATIGSSSFYPAVIIFTSLPTGVTASYSNTTGLITFTGLPATLASAEVFNIEFNYTAPGSGIIPASSAITTTSTDANPANNNSSGTTFVGPDLTVAKSHTGNFFQGQSGAQYTITVSNGGTLDTTGTVTLIDTLPAGLTYVSGTGTGWACGAVGQVVTCTSSAVILAGGSGNPITLTVNVAAGAGSPLVNSVTVSGGGENNTSNDTAADPTIVTTPPDLRITKSHSGSFIRGLKAGYTITVSNIGGTDTFGTITVVDTLPAGQTYFSGIGPGWTCGAVGQVVTCTSNSVIPSGGNTTIALTINVAAAAGSGLANNVSVSGGGETNTINDTNTDSAPVVAATWDMAITKTHTDPFTQGQQNAVYTITVTNVSTTTRSANNTTSVTDILPAGLTYVSAVGTGWTCGAVGQTVTCTNPARLNASTSFNPITLTVNVALNATSLVNTAATSTPGETYTGNNTVNDPTTIKPASDLTITKSHTGNFYRNQIGAQYTIIVNNIGGGATTATVTVTDTLPAGLTYSSGIGTGWSCSAVGQVVTCTSGTVIAAGTSGNPITLAVNVAAGAGSPLVNNVIVSGGGETNATNDAATDSTIVSVTVPDLTITKSHAGNFTQGQNGATYTITPRNSGTANTNATITVTDTLPTGLTYVSGTGTGWACSAVGQVVTCTSNTVINAGANGNAITLTVNVALNAGSPLVNNVSVSGGGETYTANDTATDSTTVNQLPDLTVTKTHLGVFYLGQNGAQYAITVNNIGGGATTGTITVSDTLPTGMTYVSGAGTGWACSAAGQVVTCTSSSAIAANGGASQLLTLTVNISGSAPYTLTNNAIVGLAGQSESDTTNNIGSDTTSLLPTLVFLSDFMTYEQAGQVFVRWETASELNTLGFNLFRLDPATGEYKAVNSGLLPGIHKPHRGGIYTLRDMGASPGGTYTYVLSEIETNGSKLSYGPFTVSVEKNAAYEIQSLSSSSDYSRIESGQPEVQKAVMQARKAALKLDQAITSAVSTGNAIKIAVTDKGIYYVDAQDISSRIGWSVVNIRYLIGAGYISLSSQGRQVAYLPATNNSGLYFYGTGIDSIYTTENIYWIKIGSGIRMKVVKGKGPAALADGETFTETLHFEQDLKLWETLFNDPNADYWFWEQIFASSYYTDDPRTFNFEAPGLADPLFPATLQVHLFGASDAGVTNDHHVVISINGVPAGEDWWSGQTTHTITVSSPINQGDNTLTVTGIADPGVSSSFILIDSFDVTYQRLYEADKDRLFFRGDGNQPITVGVFASPDIMVFDITDPFRPILNTATTIGVSSGANEVSMNPASGDTPYIAVSGSGIMNANINAAIQGLLTNKNNSADYIIIAPAGLMSTAQGLADYRTRQGLKTMVIDVEDIMNEFNNGISSPEAIKNFLSYVHSNWKKAPRYVVLAGDGSIDYKDNLGLGGNLIPTKMVPALYGLAASDNYLADLNGDHMPEIAIGRLPVNSPDELQTVINKIKTYESGHSSNQVILLADTPDDGGNFIADSNAIAGLFPSTYTVNKIYLYNPAAIDDARSALFTSINNGAAFLNYVGHAGENQLSNYGLIYHYTYPLYDPPADDLPSMTNANRLPVMTAMTCLAGNFASPYEVTMTEALVLKADGGVVAAWAATGLSDDAQARILNKEFYKAFLSGEKTVLGDAVLHALSVYKTKGSFKFMMDIYNILGDPALKMKARQ